MAKVAVFLALTLVVGVLSIPNAPAQNPNPAKANGNVWQLNKYAREHGYEILHDCRDKGISRHACLAPYIVKREELTHAEMVERGYINRHGTEVWQQFQDLQQRHKEPQSEQISGVPSME